MHVKPFEVELNLMDVPSYRLQKLLYVYVSPVIVVVGLFGNIISLLVLSARPMRRVSTYCYLAVLSAVDSLVLGVGLLPKWLDEVWHTHGECKPSHYCNDFVFCQLTFIIFDRCTL